MNISWLGHNSFKISEKIDGQEVVVVTDPYGKETGLFPPKLKADIVTISRHLPFYNSTDKVVGNIDEPTIIDRPGEYEVKKVHVYGIESNVEQEKKGYEKNIIYKIDLAGITVAHLGALQKPLTEKQVEELGNVDILLVPVGDKSVISGNVAAEVVRQIEPRIVVPMHYKIKDLSVEATDESKFVKEMGGKAQTMDKIKLSRRDLPEDQTQLIILDKI